MERAIGTINGASDPPDLNVTLVASTLARNCQVPSVSGYTAARCSG